jgi:hypothetical protein
MERADFQEIPLTADIMTKQKTDSNQEYNKAHFYCVCEPIHQQALIICDTLHVLA